VVTSQVAVEILGGDASVAPQEALQALVSAVDGLQMEVATHTLLTSTLVEDRMGDALGLGTGPDRPDGRR